MRRILCLILSAIMGLVPSVAARFMPNEKGETVTAFQTSYNEEKSETEETFDLQKINTVEINLKSNSEVTVTIESDGEKLYERTGNESYRFCAFDTVETDKIKITVSPSTEIGNITVSYKTYYNREFRVTAYAVANTLLDKDKIDRSSFDVITDVILFGCVTFDESGKLNVDEELLEAALKNLKDAIGEREVNIYLNILGPDPDGDITDWNRQMESKAKKHSAAFKNQSLIEGINSALEKYGFDGIFFDYEFPLKQKYWNDFSGFLKKLDDTADKKIGIAVADWNMMINKKGLRSVDMIELMQYDLFDSSGNHSSFDVCVSGAELMRKLFIPSEKVDMGIPFYGRPTDASATWLNYNEYAQALGKGNDHTDTQYGTVYFNSYQTVYDKTAYSMSRGLGGVMVWHYACDITDTGNELSLFGAMKACIEDRQKADNT